MVLGFGFRGSGLNRFGVQTLVFGAWGLSSFSFISALSHIQHIYIYIYIPAGQCRSQAQWWLRGFKELPVMFRMAPLGPSVNSLPIDLYIP